MALSYPDDDMQDPLPESNWLWRRVFVFVVTGVILWMISQYGDRFADVAAVAVQNKDSQVVLAVLRAMLSLIKWLLSGLFLMILFYMVAPSAEQITKMIQVARSLRQGVIFSGAQRSDTPETSTSSSTVAGLPVEPPAVAPAAAVAGAGAVEVPREAPVEPVPDTEVDAAPTSRV